MPVLPLRLSVSAFLLCLLWLFGLSLCTALLKRRYDDTLDSLTKIHHEKQTLYGGLMEAHIAFNGVVKDSIAKLRVRRGQIERARRTPDPSPTLPRHAREKLPAGEEVELSEYRSDIEGALTEMRLETGELHEGLQRIAALHLDLNDAKFSVVKQLWPQWFDVSNGNRPILPRTKAEFLFVANATTHKNAAIGMKHFQART